MKYLHLINDTLFTNYAIKLFEQCNPGNNIFLIGVKDENIQLKYTEKNEFTVALKIQSKEYFHFIEEKNFDILVVHFMHSYKSMVVNKLKKNVKIVWLAWGGDILNTGNHSRDVYQPITRSLVNKLYPPPIKMVTAMLRNVYYLFSFGRLPATAYKKAIRKVNYCATVIPDEFDILAKEFPCFNAIKVPFAYASIEHYFKVIDTTDFVKGQNILVGNSINATSNHMDAFHKLHILNIKDRDIIVPLNYGEELKYKAEIIVEGKKMFNQRFIPLLNIQSEKEYIEILKGCNVAIMNHERQQAVGNIIILLWLGCKVFLSENSVVFSFFKRKGFKVYSFQKELDEDGLNTPLDWEDIKTNRMLLVSEYGHAAVIQKAKTLVDIVSGNSNKNSN